MRWVSDNPGLCSVGIFRILPLESNFSRRRRRPISSHMITVMNLGRWPVRCRSKTQAASATCCATDKLDLFIALLHDGRLHLWRKKSRRGRTPKVFDHVGLLVNGPVGSAGLPFT